MTEQRLFSNQKLIRLIIPLVVEQALTILVGMCDGVMVSSVGEAAISGVSLVDMINNVILVLFAALATGGAVVTSQYIGRQEPRDARNAAAQILFILSSFSLLVAAVVVVGRHAILRGIFGSIDADVMRYAETYFLLSALSYPFIGLYNAGAALFRAQGNSKISMLSSLVMNVVNIGGNAVLIYGFRMGVMGAALASLVSRAIACAVVGVIIGTVTGTGLSYRLSSILVDIAGGKLALLLVITMLAAIVLGMGLPSSACYLVLATLVAPAIIQLGVTPMAAHLFVFYYGIISNVTPPVAMAAYAAAGIADCNPSRCGFQAFRLSIAGFLLPFFFVYNNVLLFDGTPLAIFRAFVGAVVGIYCLACAMQGYLWNAPVNWLGRLVLFAAAVFFDFSPIYSVLLAGVLGVAFTKLGVRGK